MGGRARARQHEEQPGITWLELLILYEMHGGNKAPESDKAQKRLNGGTHVTDEMGKALEEQRKAVRHRNAHMHRELEAFKKIARKTTSECFENEDADLFRCSKSPINRLSCAGMSNKQAAIGAIPAISSSDADTVMRHILHQKGNASKAETKMA